MELSKRKLRLLFVCVKIIRMSTFILSNLFVVLEGVCPLSRRKCHDTEIPQANGWAGCWMH